VFDLDSVSLLGIATTLRDDHHFQSGRKISMAPRVFLGAAANPFAEPLDWRPIRLAKKVAAGAQFIQTQYCFDIPRLRQFMTALEDLGLIDRVFLLVGVGPLRSAKAAEWMRMHVPGLHIPDAVIRRLAGADDPAREGRNLCVELIQEIRAIRGVHGVHVMAYRQEESVAEVIDRSQVLAGRVPWFPARDTPPIPAKASP
jgi:methylenetetrahydrofolate reductase (NADPH)